MTRYASGSGLDAVPATAVPKDEAGISPAPPPASREPAPPLGREARRRIGRNLRLLYGDVLHQPLPDRFTALLDSLSSQSDSQGSQ